MIIRKAVIFVVCGMIGFLPMQAMAQDKVTKKERSLALELQKVWGVKDQIDELVLVIESKLPEDQRANFRVYMAKILDYDAINQVSAVAAVEVFSEDELEAMLDYYSSEHGKSAELKRKLYNEKMMPQVQALIKKGMMMANVPSLPGSPAVMAPVTQPSMAQ
jgi:hypothetical protein